MSRRVGYFFCEQEGRMREPTEPPTSIIMPLFTAKIPFSVTELLVRNHVDSTRHSFKEKARDAHLLQQGCAGGEILGLPFSQFN